MIHRVTDQLLPRPDALFDLKGRVAIITGGAGTLGGVFARVLAGAGAHLVLVDINGEAAMARARDLERAGAEQAIGVAVDLSDEHQIVDAVSRTEAQFGAIDILVNNAAARSPNFFAPLAELPLQEWDQVMRVNLTAMFVMVRAAERLLVASAHASIINISSIYGISAPDPGIYQEVSFNTPSIYSASKAGVIGLTRYLATYYAHTGIRCNAITPGGVFHGQPDPFVARYAARTPLGRMANADELAPALLYLASDASSYVTGHNLVVDGGWTAW